MVGYGRDWPDPKWPGGARLALQFVINFEEGGENSILHGDAAAEAFLSDIVNAAPLHGVRHINMESHYEYGSRVGWWRLRRLFTERGLPVTVFAVGMALQRVPEIAASMVEAGFEIASHGWRWIDYQYVDAETERAHIDLALDAIERVCGIRPVGWYTGRMGPNTRQLVAERGGLLYDADSYADELPYWVEVSGKPHLVVPYTLEANDMRFTTAQGFGNGAQFFEYLKDSFDLLYAEGETRPRMMSVGLHCRLAGRPGRAAALARFLDYAQGHERVWICRRVEIATHWRQNFPYGKAP
jgi:putative urate catabolism protein